MFTKEITDARFFFLDKFILLASGNALHLYKYHLDTAKRDDVRRCVHTV